MAADPCEHARLPCLSPAYCRCYCRACSAAVMTTLRSAKPWLFAQHEEVL